MEKLKWVVTLAFVAALGSLAGPEVKAAPGGAAAQNGQVNACAILSAADAQKIMGVPMVLKKVAAAKVCMYEEATQRPNALGKGTVSLTVNERGSKAAEDAAWAGLKEVRHLKAGQKNVHVLSGLGDEAYFTGNTEKGKVGVSGVIVRKGNSDFALDVMVLEYVASPEAMKSTAKRIADGLN